MAYRSLQISLIFQLIQKDKTTWGKVSRERSPPISTVRQFYKLYPISATVSRQLMEFHCDSVAVLKIASQDIISPTSSSTFSQF